MNDSHSQLTPTYQHLVIENKQEDEYTWIAFSSCRSIYGIRCLNNVGTYQDSK
jgi:hypothetical protein